MGVTAEIVPWISLVGACAALITVIKFYQDRIKIRVDRAAKEQQTLDSIKELERNIQAAKEDAAEAHNAATSARAHAELARGELHTAQLTFAHDFVSNRDLGESEKRLATSMDQMRTELRGLNDRLDRILEKLMAT